MSEGGSQLPGIRWPRNGARIAEGLTVWRGAANAGVLRRGGRVLLFGGADAGLLRRARVEPGQVDWVLLAHHHRTAAEGVAELAAAGVRVAVPEAERHLVERAEEFWADDSFRIHTYAFHPSPQTLRESAPVARRLADGDTLEWQGVTIRAVATPGPTDGALSYLVTLGGTTVAFVGDLMCAPGRFWEFHSLQGSRPFPDGGAMMEYHGFGERAWLALDSLDRLVRIGVDCLVPTHGEAMHRPAEAVAALRANLTAAMDNYSSISAAQWHFAGTRPEWPADNPAMRARCRPAPAWVREVGGTSRAIVSDSGHAFLIDCDGDVPERIAEMQRARQLGPVERLWITHYHDDHVGRVGEFRTAQRCPVIAHETMADILRRPDAYRMPCLVPDPITVDRVTREGESWVWRGYRFTAYPFPGQTLYDAALLVERGDESVLFIGDSLAPGGIDDYCAPNRNLLGPGPGLDRCLALLQELMAGPWGAGGALLINEHVEGAFTFSADEIAAMRQRLAERRELFLRLLPWDDPNYGLDPQWVRCDPYRQVAEPGAVVEWQAIVRNHSPRRRTVTIELRAPRGWAPTEAAAVAFVPPCDERSVWLSARAPRSAAGRAVLGFTVRCSGVDLGEIAEGVVDFARQQRRSS